MGESAVSYCTLVQDRFEDEGAKKKTLLVVDNVDNIDSLS